MKVQADAARVRLRMHAIARGGKENASEATLPWSIPSEQHAQGLQLRSLMVHAIHPRISILHLYTHYIYVCRTMCTFIWGIPRQIERPEILTVFYRAEIRDVGVLYNMTARCFFGLLAVLF